MYITNAKKQFKNLKNKKDVIVLAFESSCDETSVSIVKNGREILGSIVSSQIDIHKKFGGVVPEVASRNHILVIDNITKEVMNSAKLTFADIDAIAVTYGAGLVGALMVGVTYAKSLAFALNLPLIKVNHIKAHISANYLTYPNLKPPFLALVVSGGHTALLKIKNYTDFKLIATTFDDAIGEAFDKVAKVLGLEYPGGPVINKLAEKGNINIQFIKTPFNKKELSFSYSGLKTSVINYIHKLEQNGDTPNIENICASFQAEAVREVVEKSIYQAVRLKEKTIVVAGGVSANTYLREKLIQKGKENGIEVLFPEFKFCTDNADMVGSEAYFLIKSGKNLSNIDLTAEPNINLKYSNRN